MDHEASHSLLECHRIYGVNHEGKTGYHLLRDEKNLVSVYSTGSVFVLFMDSSIAASPVFPFTGNAVFVATIFAAGFTGQCESGHFRVAGPAANLAIALGTRSLFPFVIFSGNRLCHQSRCLFLRLNPAAGRETAFIAHVHRLADSDDAGRRASAAPDFL